jgi:hypothetical protein
LVTGEKTRSVRPLAFREVFVHKDHESVLPPNESRSSAVSEAVIVCCVMMRSGFDLGKGRLTAAQYAWAPGNGGLEATNDGDSPSAGPMEVIDWTGFEADRGRKTEF